ncbi:Uncharacterised protein [Candidatus Ornithobacterium hominis]|uniref:Uncharacterized protein n=1 Tax=Candidatus Ornithobacterium hominis TaxID=2497989 RepID=A0A383TX34_9FLAO|nr:hypothetical protein [Candidatus Ornithobacterium hominis]MCT7904455.1 hypothetical protein [Candidatus Ornithobacterium hominis]CAI9430367.1 hypothetical protein MSHRCOH1_09205 [Candidatus Ornithobacterium hominis]SZD71353.1 Uncharacterised protein [Candidatus Ornithobacterium hominis]
MFKSNSYEEIEQQKNKNKSLKSLRIANFCFIFAKENQQLAIFDLTNLKEIKI